MRVGLLSFSSSYLSSNPQIKARHTADVTANAPAAPDGRVLFNAHGGHFPADAALARAVTMAPHADSPMLRVAAVVEHLGASLLIVFFLSFYPELDKVRFAN